MPPDIVFEDNHLLVVNKPAGLLTQPSGTEQDNLEGRCKAWLKEKYKKPGHVFLEAVHRLDKPVSGLVVFAKTSKALSRLNSSQREKKSFKYYLTLLEKIPEPIEGTLKDYLVHDEYKATLSSQNNPNAKLCVLHYKFIKKLKDFALIEVQLETGRYHQIRAQLAARGTPIVGDVKYGSRLSTPLEEGIPLHHHQLIIPHPVTGENLTFKVQAPWGE